MLLKGLVLAGAMLMGSGSAALTAGHRSRPGRGRGHPTHDHEGEPDTDDEHICPAADDARSAPAGAAVRRDDR